VICPSGLKTWTAAPDGGAWAEQTKGLSDVVERPARKRRRAGAHRACPGARRLPRRKGAVRLVAHRALQSLSLGLPHPRLRPRRTSTAMPGSRPPRATTRPPSRMACAATRTSWSASERDRPIHHAASRRPRADRRDPGPSEAEQHQHPDLGSSDRRGASPVSRARTAIDVKPGRGRQPDP